jgi:hypothetical protein
VLRVAMQMADATFRERSGHLRLIGGSTKHWRSAGRAASEGPALSTRQALPPW